jgi:hypothetical protein
VSSPLDTVHVTDTAAAKADRYLTPEQLWTALREGTGYVCRQRSPNHDGPYDETRFLMRGTFFGRPLDLVFAVESDRVVVITQTSRHADSLRGRFYERIGTTAADAVAALSGPGD